MSKALNMPTEMEVEINLRIPRVKDKNGSPVDTGSIRYIRRITVPALPTPGTLLRLATSAGVTVECEVARADWDDGKALFVVYGKYAKRSISSEEYHALVADPAWETRSLL